MNEQQVNKSAQSAVSRARDKYGRGWEYISVEARVGAAVPYAIADFRDYGAGQTASAVVSVVDKIREFCEKA